MNLKQIIEERHNDSPGNTKLSIPAGALFEAGITDIPDDTPAGRPMGITVDEIRKALKITPRVSAAIVTKERPKTIGDLKAATSSGKKTD